MSSSKVAFSCSDHTLGGSAHAMHPCDFALSHVAAVLQA